MSSSLRDKHWPAATSQLDGVALSFVGGILLSKTDMRQITSSATPNWLF